MFVGAGLADRTQPIGKFRSKIGPYETELMIDKLVLI